MRPLSERWDLLQKRLLWVYRSQYKRAKWHGKPSGIQSAILVLEGHLDVTVAGHHVHGRKDEWVILPHSRQRDQSWPEHTTFFSIGWEAQWPNGEDLFDEGLPLVCARSEMKPLEEASHLLYQAVHGTAKEVDWDRAIHHYQISLDQLLGEEEAFAHWLRTLARMLSQHGLNVRTTRHVDPRVGDLLQLLEEQDVSQPLDPEALSTSVGLGWRRLCDLFKQEIGKTPVEYLDQRRFQAVSERLLSGDESPKEIAYGMGFRHISHFSAWFRKHAGVSPRKFTLQA